MEGNLSEVLYNFRSGIHATTSYSQTQLFFNRSVNDKLPTTKKKKQNHHIIKNFISKPFKRRETVMIGHYIIYFENNLVFILLLF